MQPSTYGRGNWVVRGLGNNRYRDYLGPLVKYNRPAELLPRLITASDHVTDKVEKNNASANKNTYRNVNRSSDVKNLNTSNSQNMTRPTVTSCHRCKAVGHTTKNCPKKPSFVCFKCSKAGRGT